MKMQFDPGSLMPLDDRGTVYPQIRIVDEWGILSASRDALLAPDFTRITVSAPSASDNPYIGEGWNLVLNGGWKVVPGERKGDYVLQKSN